MFEKVDGRTDGRTTDAGVTGILIAHLGAFGSGELIMIIIIFFISATCEEHTNKAQLQKQDRNIEHIYIIYIYGLVLIF